jgi:hypothetical protein
MIAMVAVLACLAVVVPLVILLIRRIRSPQAWPAASSLDRRLIVLLALVLALFWFRPHEDTFTGLDVAAYRLMGHAFAAGRAWHEPDRMLAKVPEPLWNAFTYRPGPTGRPTRDMVFQMESWTSARTEPFFLPSLPLAAHGWSLLLPRMDPDFFVPFIGWLFGMFLLFAGFTAGGRWGIGVAIALLMGTVYPAWFLRGYFPEAVGAVMLAAVLLTWVSGALSPAMSGLCGLVAGLTLSLHPTLAAIALPLALLVALGGPHTIRRLLVVGVGFACGLAPFYLINTRICHPYGDLFNLQTLQAALKYSPYHRALGLVVLIMLGGGAGLIIGARHVQAWRQKAARWLQQPWRVALLFAAAAVPLLILLVTGAGDHRVAAGFKECWTGIRMPYGLLLAAGGVALMTSRAHVKGKSFFIVLLLIAPLFFYLKGMEPAGLWSQRRLLPLMLPLSALLLPPLAEAVRRIAASGTAPKIVSLLLLLAAGSANFMRWPAPYAVRFDRGASAWVGKIEQQIRPAGLVVFDYFPFSVPFSVGNRLPVLGVGDYARSRWPEIMAWLTATGQATNHSVCLVSAWENPELEEGVVLKTMGWFEGSFPRVKAKACLPAVATTGTVGIALLAMTPAGRDYNAPLIVDKFFDGGPLALRGPWSRGRARLKTGDGDLPAQWSREGSGLIGPVPAPGQSVIVSVDATFSARDPQRTSQWLTLTPPWHTPVARLCISNTCTRIKLRLTRPDGDPDRPARTGIYTLNADAPYDPAREGIRGYENDLGAIIHRLSIKETSYPDPTP